VTGSIARHEARLKEAGLRRFKAEEEFHHSARLLRAVVWAAAGQGIPKTRIAELSGISRQTVHEILRG
jgi:hypothetical protein